MFARKSFFSKEIALSPYLLFAISSTLAFIYFGLILKTGKYSFLAMAVVFLLGASAIAWDKKNKIKLGSDVFSSGLGFCAIAFTLVFGAFISRDLFFGFAPLGFVLGIALLASGILRLKQYREELIILFVLGIPKILLPLLPDISPITAKFSSFLLWYGGLDVVLQGQYILLPKGAVEVVPSCSGLNLIVYMLGLSVLFLVMFPISRKQIIKIISPIAAGVIGFCVNAVRVAILALLSGDSSHDAFEYWHSQEGALIFVTISVVIYGLFCLSLLNLYLPKNQNSSLKNTK